MNEATELMTACQDLQLAAQNLKSSVARFGDRVKVDREAEIIRLQMIAADASNSRLKRAFATKLFTTLRAQSLAE